MFAVGKDFMQAIRIGSGVVGLSVLASSVALATPVFTDSIENPIGTLTSNIKPIQMGVAFDGSNYWVASGALGQSPTLGKLSSAGTSLATYPDAPDLRSLTMFNGQLYAYVAGTLRPVHADGTVSSATILLATPANNPTLPQSLDKVVFDGNYFISRSYSTIQRWTTTGEDAGSVSLSGYLNKDSNGNGHSSIAAGNGLWFTYAVNGELSAWDPSTGQRLDTTILNGAGNGDRDPFSLSFANGNIYVSTDANSANSTYNVYAAPEPTGIALLGLGLLTLRRRRRA